MRFFSGVVELLHLLLEEELGVFRKLCPLFLHVVDSLKKSLYHEVWVEGFGCLCFMCSIGREKWNSVRVPGTVGGGAGSFGRWWVVGVNGLIVLLLLLVLIFGSSRVSRERW